VGVVSFGWLASTTDYLVYRFQRFSVPSVGWTGEHRGFVVEAYCENSRSAIETRIAFCTRFALGRNAHVTFSFWGYLKEKVFKHRPRSLEDVKERIQQEMDSIPPELTRRVMKNFRERLRQCVANGGRHLSDIIFKTH